MRIDVATDEGLEPVDRRRLSRNRRDHRRVWEPNYAVERARLARGAGGLVVYVVLGRAGGIHVRRVPDTSPPFAKTRDEERELRH